MRKSLRALLGGGMLKEIIREALIEGHKVLEDCVSRGLTGVEKRGSFGDHSHQFDVIVEKAIIDSLRKASEKIYIISEEIGEVECESPELYALVDPVDGSNNVAHGLPFNASAIALARGPNASDVVAAGVIDHSTGKIYLGDPQDILIDGEKPKLKTGVSLSDALVFLDLASLKKDRENSHNPTELSIRLARKARHVRFFAAASLEIAYILEGRGDAFVCFSRDLKLMDFLASAILLKWAGGDYKILGESENPSLLDRRKYGIIAASSRKLLDEIIALID